MSNLTVCTNCGAPIEQSKCSFCGHVTADKKNDSEIFSLINVADLDFESGNYSSAFERYELLINKNPSNLYLIYKRAVSQFYLKEFAISGKIIGDFNNYFSLFSSLRKVFDNSDSKEIKSEIRAHSKKILSITHRQIILRYKDASNNSQPYDNFSGDYNSIIENIVYFHQNSEDEFKKLLTESIDFKHNYYLELISAYINSCENIDYALVKESTSVYLEFRKLRDEENHNKFKIGRDIIGKFHQNHILIILNYLIEYAPDSNPLILSLIDNYFNKCQLNDILTKDFFRACNFYENGDKIVEMVKKYFESKVKTKDNHAPSNNKTGCFIATAAMGDYNHPVVIDLRNFRDEWLLKRAWGISFTNWYYTHGPKAANLIEKSSIFKKITYFVVLKPLQLIARKFL